MGEISDGESLLGEEDPEYGVVSKLSEAAVYPSSLREKYVPEVRAI